jgi:magnesium and cobalt transporter
MGDADSGSSSAAQSAQDQTSDGQRGLFGRIYDALMLPAGETPVSIPQQEQVNGVASASAVLGLVNLRRMRVEDVAIPKAEIVSVPVDIHKDDLVRVFRESGLSRLPVYKDTLDSPMGMVHLKDLALIHGFSGTGERFSLRKMLRPLLFAPPSMPIGVLLQKMQSDRMHLALVIDEYGGVDGLVSIEDLIEQVIGEIADEHDQEEDRYWTLEKPGCYLAQSKTPIDEFEAEIGLKLIDDEDEEEFDTLGGLVFMLTGRVPARGEVIPHPAGPEFEIVDADPRRVKRLRVRVPLPDEG